VQQFELAWIMREVVIASSAGENGWPLIDGFSGHWFRLTCLWIVGLSIGLGEIPIQLRTTTPAGAVTFLKASSRPFSSCLLLCDGGNPRSSLLVQVVAALWCRFLLGCAIRVV
jgi:hypothetical protein